MRSQDPNAIAVKELALDATVGTAGSAPASLPDVLPVLALNSAVIFPGMVVPLLIDSSSSVHLVDDVVAGDRWLGVALLRRAEAENPGLEDLHPVGCAGRVLRMLKHADNTVRVLVEGLRRIRLTDAVVREPYLRVRPEWLQDVVEDTVEVSALARKVREKFLEVVELSPALGEPMRAAVLEHSEAPGRLADLVAGHVNIPVEERQRLLQEPHVRERLRRLLPMLSREVEVLTLGSKIQKEVASALTKSQRDFFLREQLRAIQRELGESPNGTSSDLETLESQITGASLPEEVNAVAQKEIERLHQTPPASPEYIVARNYLDCLLTLPWHTSSPDTLDLEVAGRVLDRQHHGLAKVKDRLLEFLAVLKLNQEIKGPILCLVGPPGVGKTSLGQSVAEALGRRFVRISLGGVRDEAEIRGHRRTYVGAMPGRIIQSLRRVGTNNPVVLLDEVDKIGTDSRGDPAAALLEVLDPAQNRTFTDHYLDLPFDLSRVLFLATANWLDPVHPALRDRMEVISLPSYTVEEKQEIARRHLAPRQWREHGLRPAQVRLPKATLQRLIREYTREAGVRQLERSIAALARKAARRLATPGSAVAAVRYDPAELPGILGPPPFPVGARERIRDCGIALGLAWTPVGGEVLFIEATRMRGSGKLLLTGSLGDVMKESAQAAYSFLRSQASSLGLPEAEFDKQDLHVHVPAGATPKDGPSAGLTIFVALASLLTRRLVRPRLAMTGEISLRGRILPVGGIQEKVLAAARAGVETVLLPALNRPAWDEVPPEVQRQVQVHFLEDLRQALTHALVPAAARRPTRGQQKRAVPEAAPPNSRHAL